MIRNNKTFKAWMAVAIVVAILLIDQIIKIEVKTNMTLGEAKRVTDWFYIEFIENNGMAYGMKFINNSYSAFSSLCYRLYWLLSC